MVKNLPAMQTVAARSLGQEDPLEKGTQPTPVFLPVEFHGQRSLAGSSPWGCKESDMNIHLSIYWGFPGGTSGKDPACQYKRCKRHGFDPWVHKIPWRREWLPTPVFLPGEFHDLFITI